MKGYKPEREKLAEETSGYRIKYYRLQSGLTQNELGKLCGLNGSTIKNYELNIRTPDMETLAKIAEILKINIYALADTDLTKPESAIHALFDLEKLYGLHPERIDGKLCLVTDIQQELKPDAEKNRSALLNDYIGQWLNVLESSTNDDNNTEDYLSWQSKFNGQKH